MIGVEKYAIIELYLKKYIRGEKEIVCSCISIVTVAVKVLATGT